MIKSLLNDKNKKREEENGKSSGKVDKNVIKMDESDLKALKESILFKNWSQHSFLNFLEDNRILLKKFKYKDVVGNERECKKSIFVIKSGEIFVWIKISRLQIKRHQKNLEKYVKYPNFNKVDVEEEKEKHSRDVKIKSESNDHLIKPKYLKNGKAKEEKQNTLTWTVLTKSVELGRPKLMSNLDNHADNESRHNFNEPDNPPAQQHHVHFPLIVKETPVRSNNRKQSINYAPANSLRRLSQANRVPVGHNRFETIDFNKKLKVRRSSSSSSISSIESSRNDLLLYNTRANFGRLSISQYSHSNENFHGNLSANGSALTAQEQEDNDLLVNDADNPEKELEKCFKLKTKYSEIWNEIFKTNPANVTSCYVKMMKLRPKEIFGVLLKGLSDYLFDEKREKEKILDMPKNYQQSESSENSSSERYDQDEEADESHRKFNKYHLITNSKSAQLFIIDKEAYLKSMLTFTTDKSLINKYLDQLRDSCAKLPTRKRIDEEFFRFIAWKSYKKSVYTQQLNYTRELNKKRK